MNKQVQSEEFINHIINKIANQVEEKLSSSLKQELSNYSVEKKIPPCLNTTEFYELTGISYKKQSYLRQTNQIGYSKNDRSITYKREDVEEFLDKHHVPAKKEYN
jgi:hypothetical protein